MTSIRTTSTRRRVGLLALLGVTLTLAACGSASDTAASSTSATRPPATTAAPPPPTTTAAPPRTYSSDPVTNRACTLASQADLPSAALVLLQDVPDSVLKAGVEAGRAAGVEMGREIGAACPQYATAIVGQVGKDAGDFFTRRYRADPSLLPTATTAPPTTTTTARPAPTTTVKPTSPALVWLRGAGRQTWDDVQAALASPDNGIDNAQDISDRFRALADGVPRGDNLGEKAWSAFDACADAWSYQVLAFAAPGSSTIRSIASIKHDTCRITMGTMKIVLEDEVG